MAAFFNRNKIKNDLLLMILNSKRLFKEHLNVLEECVAYRSINIQNLEKPALLSTPRLVGCALSLSFGAQFFPCSTVKICFATVGGMACALFAYQQLRYKAQLTMMSSLISEFEQFDDAVNRSLMLHEEIRRNGNEMNYFLLNCLNKDLIEFCITNCKEAITKIYNFETVLEAHTTLLAEYDHVFDKLELLEKFILIEGTKTPDKQAKVLHKLFLYIQSHCLFRLGLSICSNEKNYNINTHLTQLVYSLKPQTTKLRAKFLKLNNSSKIVVSDRKQTTHKKANLIKSQLRELTVNMTANVNQLIAIDNQLQSLTDEQSSLARTLLDDAERGLSSIQRILSIRLDECDRLLLNVKKMLNHDAKVSESEDKKTENEIFSDEAPTNIASECDDESTLRNDEFFVHICQSEDILDNYFDSLEKLVAEEELVSKGIMKKQFQPVLRQLRERLEPIERSFKLREKQALKMKGIEIPDEPEEDSEKKEPLGPETSDSEEEASAVATKKKLNQNRYNASRSFLANKEQINLFQNIPLETPMSESILE